MQLGVGVELCCVLGTGLTASYVVFYVLSHGVPAVLFGYQTLSPLDAIVSAVIVEHFYYVPPSLFWNYEPPWGVAGRFLEDLSLFYLQAVAPFLHPLYAVSIFKVAGTSEQLFHTRLVIQYVTCSLEAGGSCTGRALGSASPALPGPAWNSSQWGLETKGVGHVLAIIAYQEL